MLSGVLEREGLGREVRAGVDSGSGGEAVTNLSNVPCVGSCFCRFES